jgi:transcriptional regulator with XRE-family HTH domain
MATEFTERLKLAFDFASMADIARKLGLPHATVRNYFQGRLPSPDVLIKIANQTNISLNWLLTGFGEMYAGPRRELDLGRFLEEKIEEIVERKLATRRHDGVQDLGTVDEQPAFDVEAALIKLNDPQLVMNAWFQHEGRDYPKDYGIVFFRGWETYSDDEKLDAIRDAKKVLDRTLKK